MRTMTVMLPQTQGKRVKSIAFNMLFIDKSSLSGPGYYAVQTFYEMAALVAKRDDISLIAFVQRSAVFHFPTSCHHLLHVVDDIPGGRIARVFWEQVRLPFITRKVRIDLLFSPGFVSPFWGSRYFVACIHDMYYAVIPGLIDTWQRRYWKTFIPLTVRRCQRLIAVSTQTASDLVRVLPPAKGKVRVTKLASRLSPSLEIADPTVAQPYILMVANLTANKNVETILRALKIINRRGHELRMVHVGRDPDNRLAESPVVALGKVSDEVLSGLYCNALAVVNASLYEGFGMPAVEAQAMGAPLISSNHPALLEAAGADGALFYDPRDSEQLAAHIISLLVNPNLRSSLRERGMQNAATMSWTKVAQQTLSVFDEVLT